MPSLAETARTTVRGEKNAHVGYSDPLENRGWAVWHAVRTGVVRVKGKPSKGPNMPNKGINLGDVDGWEVEINLTTKMKDLWKELANADTLTKNAFTSEVRQFLQKSGNMAVLRSPGLVGRDGAGAQGQPVWWVRDEWNDAKAVGIFKTLIPTSAERRLSPAEAGENRPPEPVTIRRLDQVGNSVETEFLNETREQQDQRINERYDRIKKVLRNAEYPLYQAEVADRADVTNWMAGRALREMTAEGKIFRRYETSEERTDGASGRFHFIYWDTSDIPTRDAKLYRVTKPVMERINAMKPGDSMKTSWLSGGIMREVRELVEAGILEFLNEGTDDERILMPTGAGVADVEAAVEETREDIVEDAVASDTVTVNELDETVLSIGVQIQRLVNAEVGRLTGGLDVETLRQQLAEERSARSRAETALIAARTELSHVKQERDDMVARLEAVKQQLGF